MISFFCIGYDQCFEGAKILYFNVNHGLSLRACISPSPAAFRGSGIFKLERIAAKDRRAGSGVGCIKTKTHAMYCLEVHLWVGLEIFSQFGNEHIHAPAQEIIVLSQDVQQDFFPF
jgi:hypothetical protein